VHLVTIFCKNAVVTNKTQMYW